ncbi:glycosyltransferase involved in cell wall biosynthesis [Aurantimonas endophytica]|uniref:Glycosyltransferase involved in cell wall biosynthesis n=2 Tax=Aurantimonas endophytica TaxID=1522175 RepID=A0A7W6MPL5_9HYPH|nr:glycosyltransferase involved in cell wall biosynthesis [Aurantimonas endophytica]
MIRPPDLTLVVDVRCLQDPNFARRGVGRHALALLRNAPQRFRLIGLCDPDLPPLIPEARACLAGTTNNAYAAAGADGFVELSPMTHDPRFVMRLMQAPDLVRVTVVYDFIPRRNPAFYLGTPSARLGYAENLRWLASFDLFCPISRSAGDDLADLLGIAAHRIRTTGAPVDPVFARAAEHEAGRQEPRHLLVVAGPDPRKNPEIAILAHARSQTLQSQGIPLVIAGNYGPDYIRHFAGVTANAGGRPELLEVPGHLDDDALVDVYARAIALFAPSRDEGFSLPVVEGMAAGLPSVGSDIPAHRELLPDDRDRFSPDDVVGLSALMERLAFGPELRAETVARQAGVWRRYLDHEVGSRFWNAISRRFASYVRLPHPMLVRGRRPRVALLTPLPPDRSGVADYTAATIAELGQLVDLDVFTQTADPAPTPGAASVRPLDSFAHVAPCFDRVISVIGNSHFHTPIFEMLRRYGGAAIAHDARMLGFYRILLGEQRALDVASRELGRKVEVAELNGWLADEGSAKALFLGEILEAASPMIVHSPVTVRLLAERHGTPPAYVPFSIYRPWDPQALTPLARAAARQRLGLADDEVAIASFGGVSPSKAPEECVWALDFLRQWGIPASLHFVGNLRDMHDGGAHLRAVVERLGLRNHVRFQDDFVPEQTYRDYLVGADLALQLRTYTLGGLSGALLDCAAVGLPTVANRSLADAVGVPASYNRGVNDALSPLLIAEALAELHEAGLGRQRPEEERRAFSEERSLARYSQRLCRVLGLGVEAAQWRVPEHRTG